MIKCKHITDLRPYFICFHLILFTCGLVFHFKFSHVDIKTPRELRCFWETSPYICMMSAPGPSSVKFKTSKDPRKDTMVRGELSPAGSVSSAERSGEKRGREVDVVLHSLLVCLVCILMLLFCLFRLSFSFIFHSLHLSGRMISDRGREATVATDVRPNPPLFSSLTLVRGS